MASQNGQSVTVNGFWGFTVKFLIFLVWHHFCFIVYKNVDRENIWLTCFTQIDMEIYLPLSEDF